MQTAAVDIIAVVLAIDGVLLAFQGHQVFLGLLLLGAGLIGIGLAWAWFFRRLSAYRRDHRLSD